MFGDAEIIADWRWTNTRDARTLPIGSTASALARRDASHNRSRARDEPDCVIEQRLAARAR